MKTNLKIISAFVLGLIVSGITAYAITQIAAADVTYDNTNSGLESADVQGALNELYESATKSRVSYIDFNNLIYQQSYNNASSISYTATEDCYVVCYPRLWAGRSAVIKINGQKLITYSTYSTVSYGVGADIPIPARKGDTVTITFSDSTNGTNYIRVFGLSDTIVAIP